MYNATVDYEWDPSKATINLRKHGVHFSDAAAVLEDVLALTILDLDESTADEERYVTVGMDAMGRILVVVWTWRNENTLRVISARKATPGERRQYETDEI